MSVARLRATAGHTVRVLSSIDYEIAPLVIERGLGLLYGDWRHTRAWWSREPVGSLVRPLTIEALQGLDAA